MNIQKLKREVCIHEASHAVIADLLGMPIKKIVIDYKHRDIYCMIGMWNIRELDIAVTIAGWVADNIINKHNVKFNKSIGASDDFKKVKKFRLKPREFNSISKIVYSAVRKHKKIIVKLAKYLLSIERNFKSILGKGKFNEFIKNNLIPDSYKKNFLLKLVGI